MKNYKIKILVIVCLLGPAFAGLSYGQDTVYVAVESYQGYSKEVKSESGATRADNVFVVNLKSSSPNLYTLYDTTGAALDSASFGFTSFKIFIYNDAVNGAADTLYVSASKLFPAGATIKLLGSEWREIPWAVEKIYYKFGYTPTAGKILRMESN